MSAADVDRHTLEFLLEIEGLKQGVGRGEEDLSFDFIDTRGVLQPGRHLEHTRHLAGEKHARQQHTDDHALGQIMGEKHDGNCRQHDDGRCTGMALQIDDRLP
ncbi:hypothetical protein D3C87_1852440 [compost metagenome]